MRKIALIMDNWKRCFTYAWPAGIMQRIREKNEDVNLYIFSSFGNWSRSDKYNIGEYNIYNLPDFKDFDGIILDLNNISSNQVLEEVTDRAAKAQVPVISISQQLADFYYVGIDNYSAMREIIEHLAEHHNCQSFWFVLGPEKNYESQQREQALRDYMQEHQIPFSEEDFVHVDFDFYGGMKGFQTLKERHEQMPDAVICVNDNIAVGVCEAAEAAGYSVPKDFYVTGFDNFDKAEFYQPRITTVSFIREKIGYRCAELLLKLWEGQAVPKRNLIEVKCVFGESCGCNDGEARDIRKYLKENILYGIDSTEFEAEILELESEMKQCYSIEEMMYCIHQCLPILKCDAMYLVLDDHINAYKEDPDISNWNALVLDAGFCQKGYSGKMHVRFAYEKNKMPDHEYKEMKELFPTFDSEEGGKDFVFLPLHFGEYTIGFFVIQNASYLMKNQYLFQIVNALTGSMENLHRKEKVEYMNRQLSSLYVKDTLTGMYNRMGYQKFGQNYFQIMHFNKKKILILFVDLDRLKYINDNFGHEYGDIAIAATARSILKYAAKDAVPSRTGGDEFVLVQGYISEEQSQEIIDNIKSNLSDEEKRMQLPFPLTISVGYVVTDPASDRNLADYVKQADELMYADKTRRRIVRGQL